MPNVVQGLPNPMPFIQDLELAGEQPIEEALFLTFNVDLGFFEAQLLGTCQAAGAVVTIIADANMWNPDPLSVRFAGRRYHAGLAQASGARAFHPKLVVLVGQQTCLVAIGSGNVSTGGWQHNAEVWTVLQGDDQGVPDLVPNLADWLRRLHPAVALDRYSVSAVRRVATALEELAARAGLVDVGHRFVHNLDRPILEQLPSGPVDELLLSAPFHDPASRAVAGLVAHMSPTQIRVALQPGYTVLEPAALERVLAGTDAVVTADAEDPGKRGRYRHGKLVEWRVGERRWALTGSANLSASALLHTVGDGGNCELGLLSEVPRSLFPAGSPVALAQVPARRIEASDNAVDGAASAPTLLPAHLTSEGRLVVEFAGPAPQHCRIQLDEGFGTRREWVDAGPVPVGVTVLQVDAVVRAGQWVRAIRLREGVNVASAPVHVTDPNLVLRRPLGSQQTRTQRSTPSQIWNGVPLLAELGRDLQRLGTEFAAAQPIRVPRAEVETGHRDGDRSYRLDTDLDPWDAHIHDAIRGLGPHLAAFALGLPAVPQLDSNERGWTELLVDDREAAIEDETAEEADDHDAAFDRNSRTLEETQAPDHTADELAVRRRRQRWCADAVKAMPKISLTSRLLILRLTLVLHSSGNWEPDDDEPLQLITTALRQLESDGASDQLRARAASLAAVSLTGIRDRCDLSADTERTLIYREAAKLTTPLLDNVEQDLIAEYVRYINNPNGFPLDGDWVWETALELAADPLADAVEALREQWGEPERPSERTILIRGDFNNPALAAVEALGIAEGIHPLGIWAEGRGAKWALAMWIPPHLAIVEQGQRGPRWRLYRLAALSTPRTLAGQLRSDPQAASQHRVNHGPLLQAPPEARALMEALGIHDARVS
ncbi:MAG: hypothetical protein MUF33_06060 [Candidatus Nanopelagicales bacterium]|nr:hypothetical protein [Candidatus Nanopelagicales bacterium]MCU0298069.1 hypothetical protein [Candidatus Nanopelagicales bacterium]